MANSKVPFENHIQFGREFGSSENPITSLSNIPVGTSGTVFLDSSIRPNANSGTYTYICFGTSDRKILLVGLATSSGTAYTNNSNGSTWRGWKQITP